MTNQLCPYCGKDESSGAMNQEHVLPRSLGGNLEPTNPFAISAHTKCNRTLGKYVDGPFTRSFLVHNARALAGIHFVDPARKPILPLFYMGTSSAWTDPSITCDLWLGPTGDHIYHFHKPYPTGPTFVGVPSWLRDGEIDPGVVLVTIVASNPAWHQILVDSIKDTFESAKLHLLNAAPDGQSPPYPSVATEHQRYVEWVASFTSTKRQAQMSVDNSLGDRFLVKLALGMGTVLLGDDYVRSPDAAMLRTALWARDTANWPGEILGTGFLEKKNKTFVELLNWNGCHTVMVTVNNGSTLGLTVNLYGQFNATMMISRDRATWEPAISSDSMVWIVMPGLRAFAGPMTIWEFSGVVNGHEPADVARLRQLMTGALQLPPVHPEAKEG